MFEVNNIKFKSSDKSILEEIINQGYSIPYNCKDGRCRNCEIFDIATGKEVLACQTKATSDKRFTCKNIFEFFLPKIQNIPVKLIRVEKKGNFLEIFLKFSSKFTIDYLRGQHIDILFGEFKRSYSIYEINEIEKYIKLLVSPVENGKATSFFSDKNIGTMLRVNLPLGNFTFRTHKNSSERSIFICTGSGITPVLNIFTDMKQIPKNVSIYWGIKRYCEKAKEVNNFFRDKIKIFVSREINQSKYNVGRINFKLILEKELFNNWYLVGNPKMIEDFSHKIQKLTSKTNIFKDPFS